MTSSQKAGSLADHPEQFREITPGHLLFSTITLETELSTTARRTEIKLLPGEYWWGGLARHGDQMPFNGQTHYRQSLFGSVHGNQASPLLVSSKGRYVWSEDPFTFEFKDGWLFVEDCLSKVIIEDGSGNLRGAYLAAAKRFFPPSGRTPHELSFTAPQYNTWIDMGKTRPRPKCSSMPAMSSTPVCPPAC